METSSPTGNAGKATGKERTQYLALLSDLMGRARLARRAGIQFGGRRDIYEVAGYVKDDEVKFDHYWSLYKRGDIAGRIVDMAPKTTWRKAPAIVEEEKPKGTPFTDAFQELAKRLKLWRYFERADRLAGIGRYSVLVYGTRGTATDNALKTDVAKVSGPDDIIYVAVYNEKNAAITDFERSPGNERYLQPTVYQIQTSALKGQSSQIEVHHSRVIHIAENVLEDDIYGRPRLERPLNRLFDLDKVAASTGEAYWQAVVRILQATVDSDAEVSDDLMDAMEEQLGEMVHDLRRQFIGQGAELSWLPTATPNPSQVVEMYFSLIAGATGYPKRILFGSELGELASSQDQENFAGTIAERQEQFAEPVILRQTVDRWIDIGALPEPETGEYQVIWPTLFQESEGTIAEANVKRAQAAAALVGPGGDPLMLVEIDEDRNVWLVPRGPGEPLPEAELPGELDVPEPGLEEEEGDEGEGGTADGDEDDDDEDEE